MPVADLSPEQDGPETGTVLIPGGRPTDLKLNFAGNVVKHLGVQMYAGRPVPAIAELVSNAWDADASQVEVTIPLGSAWDAQNPNHVIKIDDDGRGMSWEQVRDAYLDVGRDRRDSEGTDRTATGRQVQGRKGVGKLAGFGIADVVDIQTVCIEPHAELGEQTLIWFQLSLDVLRAATHGALANVIYAGPLSRAPAGSRSKTGTTVALSRLHDRKALNEDRFHWSMAQRFLLAGAGFHVTINGVDLKSEKIETQWRWPAEKGKWQEEEVEGCGPVRFWIGFTEKPRQQDEGQQSGLLVYARSKIAQEATFFEISGGVNGQHGLRYMVGQIRAEWLDLGVSSPDHIATHRGAIAWESPQGMSFQNWGQKTVKKYLAEWARLRASQRVTAVRKLNPKFQARVQQLSPAYQQVANRFVDKFSNVDMEPDEFEQLFTWFLDALENATLLNLIKKLRDTEEEDLEGLDSLLSKMEIRTATALLQILDSNLAAIETLERMHLKNAKERGVLSKHVERNPWLLDPSWMLNKAEGRVATWIRDEFGLETSGEEPTDGDDDRADFFCVGVGGALHIVEIKRGAHMAKDEDFLQADKYRTYVLGRFNNLNPVDGLRYSHVQSHLIAKDLQSDARGIKDAYEAKGWVLFSTWDNLVERAKLGHRQYREVLAAVSAQAEPEIGD